MCNAPHLAKMHPTTKMGCILRQKNKNAYRIRISVLIWWKRVDSNHRSRRQQIYSLPPLAARELFHIKLWSWWTDSNPRPADYKSAALPTELHQRFCPSRERKKKYTILLRSSQEFFYFSQKKVVSAKKCPKGRTKSPVFGAYGTAIDPVFL